MRLGCQTRERHRASFEEIVGISLEYHATAASRFAGWLRSSWRFPLPEPLPTVAGASLSSSGTRRSGRSFLLVSTRILDRENPNRPLPRSAAAPIEELCCLPFFARVGRAAGPGTSGSALVFV